jgi:isoleucyl-tRNA synthetase
MKASLTQNEPKTLKFWEEINAYDAMISANNEQGVYVLHDGPPYANGNIHLGTALNKTLKDIIVKSKNLAGFKAEYVPGWDCHGLPIEHKVETQLGGKKELPPQIVRKRCREYANKYVNIQRNEFKRLGVFGAWETPYLTMKPEYEAATAAELAHFMEIGSVTRSKKPIYWCLSCRTALAEAEVEYADHSSPSIYVRFPLNDPKLKDVLPLADPSKAFVVIWTTTPWTLPDNMAVAVHPEFEYALVENAGEQYILASELVESALKAFGWTEAKILAKIQGAALEGLQARHPFYDRPSPVVLADYVTLDAGTGCVHTAPGHGREDYETGLRYGLEVLSPLDDDGRFLDSVEHFAGLTVFEANPKVIEVIKEKGNLLGLGKIKHSYPHCWRCKKPVIFRATTQWFISMQANDLRARALTAINEQVRWIPTWGRERIYNMIENRPDWCISRQRMWGVPIVALRCEACDEAWYDADWVKSVVEKYASYPTGCDYWFDTPLEQLVPQGLTCSCGASRWKKETDILDVWFDSGTSFAAVLEKRPECAFPADLYLEGSDQHRGWFHSSLLASIGGRDTPPYRAVLTHGYVVDGEGKKMSKSVGNVIAPQQIIDKFGAEILRIWVASVDYQEDVRISDEILSRLVDAYRRIRNTCRFLLGNLDGFSPERAVSLEEMLPLDRYALDLALRAHRRMDKAYENFEFHKAFHTLHNFCVSDLSAFYLDIIKDRLYVSGPRSLERRSAQTVLWKALLYMVRDMAPILSFTAEEVYQHLPANLKQASKTVFGTRPEEAPEEIMGLDERSIWERIAQIRSEATKAIEPLRQSGVIGHSLQTHVTLYVDEGLDTALRTEGVDLEEVFIVSKVTLADIEKAPAEGLYESPEIGGLKIGAAKADGEKCERCWTVSQELGADANHPTLCPRCAAVLAE